MANSDNTTLQMLRRIDQKLEKLLNKLRGVANREPGSTAVESPSARAKQIAALTPRAVKQTDAVELLHEDRRR